MDISVERINQLRCSKCNELLDISDLEPFTEFDCPQCGARQRVPVKLGSFVLAEELGKGGMGVVYRAYDQSLGRYVAIKVMQSRLGQDKQFVSNFLSEARAAAALNHRNVVQIYSCGEERGQPYIVMELMGRARLEQSINDHQPLPEAEILRIGRDVAEGLKAGADIGLIHGDVKPANILFDKAGIAKVVDFGLASYIRQQQEGEIWGTPFYIAPEKARGEKVDARSDIYSLGATLYHGLTAQPPFDGDTASDVVLARLEGPAPPVKDVLPDVSGKTAALLDRMLSPDPVTRYPNYNSLIADIDEAIRALGQEDDAKHKSGSGKDKRPRRWVWLLALLLVILAAGGGWAWWRLLPPPAPEPVPMVPVEEPGGEEPEQTEAEPLPWQPFTEEQDRKLSEILADTGSGQYLSVLERLEKMFGSTSEDEVMQSLWLRFLQAVTAWREGDDDSVGYYLEALRSALPQTEQDSADGPIALLKNWSTAIETAPDAEEPPSFAAAPESAPAWAGDLQEFLQAVSAMQRHGPRAALDAFGRYAQQEQNGDAPAWPYGFQPAAARWQAEAQTLDGLDETIATALEKGDITAAHQALDNARQTTRAIWRPELKPFEQQVAKAVQEEKKKEQEARRKKREALEKQDLNRVDQLRRSQGVMLRRKDFEGLLRQADKLKSELKTDRGRKALAALAESYTRLQAVKQMLQTSLNEKTAPGAISELGGRPVGADQDGLTISVAGGAGQVERSWVQASPQGLARLAAYVAGHESKDPKVRADHLLSVAVFCHYYGFDKVAAHYAQTAIRLDPSLADQAKNLMP